MHRRAEHGANGTCHKLVLRVYSVRGCMHAHQAKCTAPASQACPLAVEQARVALEQHTDLREHFHLNLNFGANPLRNVPLNTVLFQLLDGYYGHKEQWRLFVRCVGPPRRFRRCEAHSGGNDGRDVSAAKDETHTTGDG